MLFDLVLEYLSTSWSVATRRSLGNTPERKAAAAWRDLAENVHTKKI
jgi:hypothetical protein